MDTADSSALRYVEELREHYERTWGPPAGIARWSAGPVHDLPKSFRVAVFPPRAGRTHWVYATLGMSLGFGECIELYLVSPRPADELVELLTAVAHYHRTGARLGLNQTVNFGRPWLEDSAATFGLISRPYLDGPDLEWLLASDHRIRNLWLLPITRAEREFKKKNGAEALERLFEEDGIDYLDPHRSEILPSIRQ